MFSFFSRALAVVLLAAPAALAASPTDGLKEGKVELQSAGPITFGPDGILFIGDPKAAVVYAVGTGDTKAKPAAPVAVEKLGTQLADLLGIKAADVEVVSVAVNPASNAVYLSVARGKTADAKAVILTVGEKGALTEVSLDKVPMAKAALNKAAAGKKGPSQAITGMKFLGDRLYVAGLSTEAFASTLRAIPVPFTGKEEMAGVEIFHGAHGKYETASPVRTFTPIRIDDKDEILAAYTCTPLVRIPVSELKDGAKVKGTTVAELGNQNKPLDIVVYKKDGKNFALIANDRRGVMKVALDGIEKAEGITTKINDKAGLKYETIDALKGVEHLDKLGDKHAVLLVKDKDGYQLRTIDLP